jgi:hypothetical protein
MHQLVSNSVCGTKSLYIVVTTQVKIDCSPINPQSFPCPSQELRKPNLPEQKTHWSKIKSSNKERLTLCSSSLFLGLPIKKECIKLVWFTSKDLNNLYKNCSQIQSKYRYLDWANPLSMVCIKIWSFCWESGDCYHRSGWDSEWSVHCLALYKGNPWNHIEINLIQN